MTTDALYPNTSPPTATQQQPQHVEAPAPLPASHPLQPDDIHEAISMIQQRLPVIEKTATNPHFGSTYTPIDDVVRKIFPMLKEYGVVLEQPLEDAGRPDMVRVKTILRHIASGSQVESVCVMPAEPGKGQQKQHAFGSSISYARRYSLTSILGIVCGAEDDDGGGPPPDPADGRHLAGAAPPPPNNANPADEEMRRFRDWIKTICPTKEDFAALCAWLAVSELPGVTPQKALADIQSARCLGRAVSRITKQQGVDVSVMMQNARHFHANQQSQNQEMPY